MIALAQIAASNEVNQKLRPSFDLYLSMSGKTATLFLDQLKYIPCAKHSCERAADAILSRD